MESVLKSIETAIDSNRDRLNNIGKLIWSNPEASFKEVQAHKLLTDFLVEEGFEVERNFISDTGFKAVYTGRLSGDGDSQGVTACLMCEYDAVGDIGHAAGHNLKTEASVAAALAVKQALKDGSLMAGTVVLLGSTGEDCGAGTKIDMIQAGVFNNIDFCMMADPFNQNILNPKFYTLIVLSVVYKGKSAHASASPWEGRNALDAAIACCNNIALLRQQLKPTMSINGVILSGGTQPNVIPDHSELRYWLRAADHVDLFLLKQKCTACFVAAAKATGCEVDFKFDDKAYHLMEHNITLSQIYSKHAVNAGIEFSDNQHLINTHTGSSDMGNVSEMVPCICPTFDINTTHVLNSMSFHEDSGTPEAHDRTLVVAKVLAQTAAEVMFNPVLMESAKEELDKSSSAQIAQRVSVSSIDSSRSTRHHQTH